MKVLLDSCVWGKALLALANAGHDVVWAGNWSEDPGDRIILQRSTREQRILVTLDKDFGEMAVVEGLRHSGIIRLVGFSAQQQGPALSRSWSATQGSLPLGPSSLWSADASVSDPQNSEDGF